MAWTIGIAIAIILILAGGIFMSFLTQYRQAEPADKYWKSLYHIHNPPEKDEEDK